MKKFILVTFAIFAILSFAGISRAEDAKPANPSPAAQTSVSNADNFDQILKSNYVDLTNWLKETVEAAGPALKDGGNFLKEQTKTQVPLFINEYLRWQIYNNLISAFFYLFLAIFIWAITFFAYKKIVTWDENEKGFGILNAAFIIFGIASLIIGIPCLFSFCTDLNAGLKPLIAPRVVMVEKVAEMIKK